MNQKPIKTIITDDEPPSRFRLRGLLSSHKDIEIVAECGDAAETLRAINENCLDLLFLDVRMPGKNGFEMLAEINLECLPVVVFVTAFDQYAVKAFEVSALDYLLKPFDAERLEICLQRVRAQIERERGGDFSRSLVAFLNQQQNNAPKYLQRLKVKTKNGFLFLKTAQVNWIEAEANYLRIHAGKSSYLARGTIGNVERLLNPQQFVRIHRSTIVNIDCVAEMHPWFQHGEYSLSLTDGTRLIVSKTYRERLMNHAGNLE